MYIYIQRFIGTPPWFVLHMVQSFDGGSVDHDAIFGYRVVDYDNKLTACSSAKNILE